jgi:murein DD-endopeptidase MepM/ murein hydrolase activator NlpD
VNMDAYPKTHLKMALAIACSLLVVITALPAREKPEMARIPVSLSIQPEELRPTKVPLAIDTSVEEVEPEQHNTRHTSVVIKHGDSLSAIFNRAGLPASELQRVMELGKPVAILKKIIPGKTLFFEIGHQGQLLSLNYEENPLKHLVVMRNGDSFKAYWQEAEAETIVSFGTAAITESHPSLYQAGKAAGLSDALIMKLSYVFQWDISFALDLRQGDTFNLLFEDIYVDGEKVKEGEILAAQVVNMGKTYTAVRYVDEAGQENYFTPQGSSLRKAFLRDPVHFSHVSSSFNMKRLHPIHNRVMPHRGIDYAANRGTPVLAAGDGKVTNVRQNNASGRYVVIQHGEQYTTKYLHLNGFAKGIRAGSSVKQGQVLGYVGDTGWATAPHLHYEFLLNGVHRNPRTVALPHAQPIKKQELSRFLLTTQTMLARLNSVAGNTSYALADQSE